MSDTSPVDARSTAPPQLWGWRTWASIAIALAALAALAARVDFDEVWREVAATDKRFVLAGLLAHYVAYYVRGARWKLVLGYTPLRASRLKYGLIVFFYNFVDNLVPAKLGDVYAAHLARINFGVRRSEALGSLVFMRMIDAWVLLGLGATSSWLLFSNQLPPLAFWALVGGAILTVVASGLIVALGVMHDRMPDWIPEKAQRILRDVRQRMFPNRRRTTGITLMTAVIWALETLWIYWLARGFGLEFDLTTVIFVAMIPLLASAFPFTPAGTGAVELALYSSLVLVGTPTAVAASFTFLNRLIDYWLHIALGVVTWVLRRRFDMRAWTESPDRVGAPEDPEPAAPPHRATS